MRYIKTILLTILFSIHSLCYPWSITGFAKTGFDYIKKCTQLTEQIIKKDPKTIAAVGACTLLATAGTYYLLKKLLFKKNNTVNPNKTVNNASETKTDVPQSATTPVAPVTDSTIITPAKIDSVFNPDYSDLKLTFTERNWDNNVLQQSGNTCGFHSLKNGLILYKYLSNQIYLDDLQKQLTSTDATIFPIAQWQQLVNKKEDLTDEDIKKIALNQKLSIDRCIILQNIAEFNARALLLNEKEGDEFINVIKNLQTLQSIPPYIFILGDMNHKEEQGKTRGNYGHWIVIVAKVNKQNGSIELHCANSLKEHASNSFVEGLKKVINTDYRILDTQRKLGSQAGTIRETFETLNISGCLAAFSKIDTDAKELKIEYALLIKSFPEIVEIFSKLLKMADKDLQLSVDITSLGIIANALFETIDPELRKQFRTQLTPLKDYLIGSEIFYQ